MRKSLLATVAAVALIAGTGMVAAEGAKEQPAAKSSGQSEMHKGADTKGGAEIKGHSQTTGAGASEMKSEPKAEMKSEPNAHTKGKAGNKAEMNGKAKPSTTGAGAADEHKAGTEMKGQEGKPGSKTEMDKSSSGANSGTAGAAKSSQGTSSTTTAQGSTGAAGGSVNLTSEQKTKIRTSVIESKSAPRLSRSQINFQINVGTVVPRTVHFVSVPQTLVEIHPAWRGYEYIVVEDEIVIIDPHTYKIVAVLNV